MKDNDGSRKDISDKNSVLKSSDQPIKRGLVFTIVSLSLLMTTIDSTIVATALETIQRELHTTTNWVGWTITGYAFGYVLMLPLSAKLSKIYGARKIYLLSVAVFTAASLACGTVNSIGALIPLRIIQAAGAAGITPGATAIIVDHFGETRDRYVSLFGSIFPIGVMIGPIFGGLFVTYLTWRDIFFVNIPLGIAVVLLSLRFIPKDFIMPNGDKPKLDLTGLMWLGIAVIAAMYGATYLGHKSSHVLSGTFISMVMISVIAFVLFFRHINKVAVPFVKPRFIYGKGFGIVNGINMIYAGVTSGCISLVPLYVFHRYDISPLSASVMLIAQGAASVIFSTIVTMILRKTGYRLPMAIGASITAVGMVGIALPPYWGMSAFWWMVFATAVIGTGIGILNPPSRNAGLQLAPDESATIAALRSQALQMGSIIVVGIATAIMTDVSDPGIAQAWIYAALGGIYFLGLPVIKGVPEFKGSW